MNDLFPSWEKAQVHEVVDYYENHFLKSLFKILAWKNQPKVLDAHKIPEKQEEGILAQLGVFDEVTRKGLADNPEVQVQERIVEAAEQALRVCIAKVDAKFGKMEPAIVAKVQKRVDQVRPKLS